MINDDYYELRHIRKSDGNSFNFYFDEIHNYKTLEDCVFENDKIVLLGNPGIGKSRELSNLFDVLWSKIDETGLIPFLINLKNFRTLNNFEDLLVYKDWESLPQIIFILDGLDEISEIEDFLSAFEIFINKHKLSNFKYVISCRTNIYEKYLVNISNFETFYVEDLTFNQTKSLLLNKYNLKIEDLNLSESHQEYLKTPFFINLFAEYILSEHKLPESDAKIWEAYVNKHLETHKIKIKKKRILNIPQEIKDLKKIAFINELRQKNFIIEDELNTVLGKNYIEFIENPFITNLEKGNEKFIFEHRQIQEYFVAKTLSNKSIQEILSIIKIGDINKVHPTLFNSVAFLINLIEDNKKLKSLIDWIKTNQIELLLKADSDRITNELRISVFQDYFKTQCIDKSYWISTSKSFSVKEIAIFGDCEENYNYLLSQINNNRHFRIVISAIELLGFLNVSSYNKESELKDFLIQKLDDIKISKTIKSHILNCIILQEFCKRDNGYFKKIFKLFKNESHKELNRSLLSLLNEYDDIDEYFEFMRIKS